MAGIVISDGAAKELRLFAHGWLGPNSPPETIRSSALFEIAELLDAGMVAYFSTDDPKILTEESSPRRHAYLFTEAGRREWLRRQR